jgi:hypothetical protein
MRTPSVTPGDPREKFPGLYRGVVEDVADPQTRKRYRVRVVNVHPPQVETQHLPWAELAVGFGGSGFGDVPAYEPDDEVWVMFEGGNRRFPVIVGGILNYAGGIPPLPPEQTGADYEETQRRWTRIDRAGNKIEMSPVEEELWVRLSTPDGSEVRVSAADGSVQCIASGRVILHAPNVQIIAAEEINAETARLIADVSEEAIVRGSDKVSIRGANEINIGEYTPPDTTGLGATPETSLVVNIKAVDLVKIESAGSIDIAAADGIQIAAGSDIVVTGQVNSSFAVQGNALLDVEGDVEVDTEGTLTVNAAQKILIESQSDIEVNAQANILVTSGANFDIDCGVNFSLHAGAAMAIDADATLTIESAANLEVTCSAALTIQADAALTLEAPIITIHATSLLDMSGDSTALLDGGVVLIA